LGEPQVKVSPGKKLGTSHFNKLNVMAPTHDPSFTGDEGILRSRLVPGKKRKDKDPI
jgi:hypothetical protein